MIWSHLLARRSPLGNVLWQVTPAIADNAKATQFANGADGSTLLLTQSFLAAKTGPSVVASGPAGEVLWRQTDALVEGAAIRAGGQGLGVGADGSFALLAREVKSPYRLARIVADRDGVADCTGASGCAGKAVSACDDAKPCTADFCDAKLGCQLAPLSGLGCGAGLSCSEGACVGL